MTSDPLISIIIPVKNGAQWLVRVLDAIMKQTLAERTEIIILDSGSTDGTANILQRYPVKIISIPQAEFNHGGTRNLGVKNSKGKYIVCTVQDAIATSDNWLEELLDGFEDDTIAGVCGQQVVPHDTDKNPVGWSRHFSPAGKTTVHFSREEFAALDPQQKKDACRWDNVNAMYRRDVLEKIPFREVTFAEDALWARDAFEAGNSLVYNTKAKVNHYHADTPEYTFRRSFTEMYYIYKFFGVRPKQSGSGFRELLSKIKILATVKGFSLKERWYWLRYNFLIRRSAGKAAELFKKELAESEEKLDATHKKLCGVAPQAPTIAAGNDGGIDP